LPKFLLNKKKSSVYGVKFGHVHTFKSVEAVPENQTFTHKDTFSLSLNKGLVGIKFCVLNTRKGVQ
jgi:hypothetical protein